MPVKDGAGGAAVEAAVRLVIEFVGGEFDRGGKFGRHVEGWQDLLVQGISKPEVVQEADVKLVECSVEPKKCAGRFRLRPAIPLQHGFRAFYQLHRQSPRIAQHGELVAVVVACHVALGGGACFDQTVAGCGHIVLMEGHVE